MFFTCTLPLCIVLVRHIFLYRRRRQTKLKKKKIEQNPNSFIYWNRCLPSNFVRPTPTQQVTSNTCLEWHNENVIHKLAATLMKLENSLYFLIKLHVVWGRCCRLHVWCPRRKLLYQNAYSNPPWSEKPGGIQRLNPTNYFENLNMATQTSRAHVKGIRKMSPFRLTRLSFLATPPNKCRFDSLGAQISDMLSCNRPRKCQYEHVEWEMRKRISFRTSEIDDMRKMNRAEHIVLAHAKNTWSVAMYSLCLCNVHSLHIRI